MIPPKAGVKAEEMAEEQQMTESEAVKFREELAGNMWEGKDAPDEPIQIVESSLQETPVVEAVADEVPVDPKPEADKEPEVDPWEGVSETVRKSLETLEAKASSYDSMSERLKQAERRVGSLQNAVQNPPKAAKAPEPAKKPELTEEQKTKVEAFKKEFPEFHDAIEVMTANLAGQNQSADVTPLFNEIQGLKTGLTSIQEQTNERIEMMQLSSKHPNFQDTIGSKDYQKWLIDQPPEIQQLTRSPRATDAIIVLDKYSSNTQAPAAQKTAAQIKSERDQKLASAQVASGRKIAAPKSESDMTDAEIRAKIEKELWP